MPVVTGQLQVTAHNAVPNQTDDSRTGNKQMITLGCNIPNTGCATSDCGQATTTNQTNLMGSA